MYIIYNLTDQIIIFLRREVSTGAEIYALDTLGIRALWNRNNRIRLLFKVRIWAEETYLRDLTRHTHDFPKVTHLIREAIDFKLIKIDRYMYQVPTWDMGYRK